MIAITDTDEGRRLMQRTGGALRDWGSSAHNNGGNPSLNQAERLLW